MKIRKVLIIYTLLLFCIPVSFTEVQKKQNEAMIKNEQEILKLEKLSDREKDIIKRTKIENLIILKVLENEIDMEIQDLHIDTSNIKTIQDALKQTKKTKEYISDTIDTFRGLITDSRLHLIKAYNKKAKGSMEAEKAKDIFENNKKILQLMTTSLDKLEDKLNRIKKGKYPQKKKIKVESLGPLNDDFFIINVEYKDTPYSLKFSFDPKEKEKTELIHKNPKQLIIEPIFCIDRNSEKELTAFCVSHLETNTIKEIEIKNNRAENFEKIKETEYYKNLNKTLQKIENIQFNDSYALKQQLMQIKSLDILDKNYLKQVNLFFSNFDKIITSVSLGDNHVVLLKANGTVCAYGLNENGQCNVNNWENIIKIAAGSYNTVGLKKDGTVVACGWKGKNTNNITNWKNIVDIKAGKVHIVGLRKDGTVVACGDNTYGQCNVKYWKDIISISTNGNRTAGIRKDGTVVACGDNNLEDNNIEYWKDIKDLKIECFATVGLKKDGTLFSCGENYGNIQTWSNVTSISVGHRFIIGLKKDGTVVACGWNDYGQCNVKDWTNIVSVSAGYAHTIGLKKDGTVVACGWNEYGQCNVKDWKDIISVCTSAYNTVGLKKDGSVVICGDNSKGQCNINN